MSKFYKIEDQVVQYPNDFEVVTSSQGGDIKTITAEFGTISEAGTALDKTLLEGVQVNSIYSVDGTRTVETVNEIYDINITDLTDALVFDELKISITIDVANTQSSNTYIRLDSVLYPIYLNNAVLPANSLKANGIYTMEYDGTRFNVDSNINIKASETKEGVAELATQTEVNIGTDDEKIVTPLKAKTHRGFTLLLTGAVNGTNTLSDNWDNYEEIIFLTSNTTGSTTGEIHSTFYTDLVTATDSVIVANNLIVTDNDSEISFNFRDTNRNEIFVAGEGDDDSIVAVYGRYKKS